MATRWPSDTYYKHHQPGKSDRQLRDELLLGELKRIHAENYSVYGVRKMHVALRREGYVVGRDQVGRLMQAAGLKGKVRGDHKTRTTTVSPTDERFPDLVKRDWDKRQPNHTWVADFTYVWTYSGFLYVAFVVDTASRRILSWKASHSKTTDLVTDTLEQAVTIRRIQDPLFVTEGIIHHSDAGSQYTSLRLGQQLQDQGMHGSIGTVGDALDNALMESTIGLYKNELIDGSLTTWKTLQQVELATAKWVHWFNTKRLHSSLGCQSPAEYELHYQQNQPVPHEVV